MRTCKCCNSSHLADVSEASVEIGHTMNATNRPLETRSSGVLSSSDWESVDCDLCGSVQRKLLFSLAHQAAPNGSSDMVQCRICGLIYISPRPKSERLSAYYASSANAYIGRTRGRFKQAAWNAARTLGLDLFDIGLNMSKGNSLLDVGCGYGDLLIDLAPAKRRS